MPGGGVRKVRVPLSMAQPPTVMFAFASEPSRTVFPVKWTSPTEEMAKFPPVIVVSTNEASRG